MSDLRDLEELKALCGERLFSDSARVTLAQQAWFLIEALEAAESKLARLEGEARERIAWRDIESAPPFTDVLGLWFGGANKDIRSYHVARHFEGKWICEGFDISPPHVWRHLPDAPARIKELEGKT